MQYSINHAGVIHRRLTPRRIDFGGFPVRRALPHSEVEAVGPWVFFDHLGPHRFGPGQGIDVIPHPHINLATVTYLFEGEIVHRDTLGNTRIIRPGAVNLMYAGRGIAHSERTGEELRAPGHRVHGLQLWCGVPASLEEDDPWFFHYPAGDIPETEVAGVRVQVIIGRAYGVESPVRRLSPTLYAVLRMPAGSELNLPEEVDECGVYTVSGSISVEPQNVEPRDVQSGGEVLGEECLAVLGSKAGKIRAAADSVVVLIGGEPLGPRYMWWNFVSSRRERIERAKDDWRDGRFGVIANDDDEMASLPVLDRHSRM